MIGSWAKRAALALVAGLLCFSPVQAAGKQKVFDACAKQMKEEFGNAAFKFDKIRRSENRNFAFGEMTLENGETRRIRCLYQRGRVRDTRFRSGSGAIGDRWTSQRPEGAVFVPFETEEEADDGRTGDNPENAEATGSPDAEPQAATNETGSDAGTAATNEDDGAGTRPKRLQAPDG